MCFTSWYGWRHKSSATKESVNLSEYFDNLFVVWSGTADILCDFRRALAEADLWISFDRNGYGNQREDANLLKPRDQVNFLDLDYGLYSRYGWRHKSIVTRGSVKLSNTVYWWPLHRMVRHCRHSVWLPSSSGWGWLMNQFYPEWVWKSTGGCKSIETAWSSQLSRLGLWALLKIWLETQIFSDERISQLIRIFW